VAQDDNIFRDDAAGDACGLPDHQANSPDIALHLPVNAQLTLRYEIAIYR